MNMLSEINVSNTNEQLHCKLLKEWQLKYKDQEIGDTEFTWDGPTNWKLWEETKPKIMFLAKEARDGYHPSIAPSEIKNSFTKNIARWRYALMQLYEKPSQKPNFPTNDLFEKSEDSFGDIAIVEVKKLNENKGASSPAEIKAYAQTDRDFLGKQIDIIAPNIVLCCNTQEIGYDIIYSDIINYEQISPTVKKCQCWKFNDRLVIDFYHPSTRNEDRASELFEVLCEIIQAGNVFEKFEWSRRSS